MREEAEFHLGFLLTEQANPLTEGLAEALQRDTVEGLRLLGAADFQVAQAAGPVFAGQAYQRLRSVLHQALVDGARIVFSGCGATGRLSILLEAMWRHYWQQARKTVASEIRAVPDREDSVISIMTGGDYALVRSVEGFEDYEEFGRQQVREAGLREGDVLVAISEGGETSSVIGTIREALDRKARVFFLFNNPPESLVSHIARSRRVIEDPRVICCPLVSGPMAVAGSTRMQATTFAMLVAGMALEEALALFLRAPVAGDGAPPADVFRRLLDELYSHENIASLAALTEYEAGVYRARGRITYYAADYLLDVLTDTTERAPTFMLPPFRKSDDAMAPASWAFVKHPLCSTPAAWAYALRRERLRCLDWDVDRYIQLGASQGIRDRPPRIDECELLKYRIGNEPDASRTDAPDSLAMLIICGDEADVECGHGAALHSAFLDQSRAYRRKAVVLIGLSRAEVPGVDSVFHVPTTGPATRLRVWEHLAVKVVLNTLSTAVMGQMGRLTGNWMACVEASNKKLVDRSVRLAADLAKVDYGKACEAVFEAIETVRNWPAGEERPSPVQLAIAQLHKQKLLEQGERWALVVNRSGDGDEWESITAEQMQRKDVREDAGGREVVWSGHGVLGSDFQVVVRWDMKPDGLFLGRLRYSGYRGGRPVEEIRFPIVTCLSEPGSGFLTSADVGHIERRECFAAGQPFASSGPYVGMQMAALLNPSRPSLYFDHRDPGRHFKGYAVDLAQDGLHFTYQGVHYMTNRSEPLSEYEIPYESGCRHFQGGWFEAGQIYRSWALTQAWGAARATVNPMREIGLWVWNRGCVAEVVPPVKRLQADCPGVPIALDWYWWHSNPYDTDYPEYWPPREGVEVFRAAVADLRANGILCQTYINGVLWDMDGPSWGEGGADEAVLLRDGQPLHYAFNRYNRHRLAWMCGQAPRFQDKIAAIVRRLRESGLDGQYLDMIGGASQGRCFNPKHGHPLGGGPHMAEGYRRLLKRLRAENPGMFLTTEYCNEAYMDLLEGAMTVNSTSHERSGGANEHVPLFPSVYHGSLALFGSYANPDGITPWDPLWPAEDRWKHEDDWYRLYPDQFAVELTRPVVWGIQPMVHNLTLRHCQEPAFADTYRFILETARFYHAHRDFLFDGRMLSPAGFSCATRPVEFMARGIFTKEDECKIVRKALPAILHSCWENPRGEQALVAVNYNREPQAWRYRGRTGVLAPYRWMILPWRR